MVGHWPCGDPVGDISGGFDSRIDRLVLHVEVGAPGLLGGRRRSSVHGGRFHLDFSILPLLLLLLEGLVLVGFLVNGQFFDISVIQYKRNYNYDERFVNN